MSRVLRATRKPPKSPVPKTNQSGTGELHDETFNELRERSASVTR